MVSVFASSGFWNFDRWQDVADLFASLTTVAIGVPVAVYVLWRLIRARHLSACLEHLVAAKYDFGTITAHGGTPPSEFLQKDRQIREEEFKQIVGSLANAKLKRLCNAVTEKQTAAWASSFAKRDGDAVYAKMNERHVKAAEDGIVACDNALAYVRKLGKWLPEWR